jgi:hypothetical protein
MSTNLDGSNSSEFHYFSAQSPPPILFADPAPMASNTNSAGLTCPGTGAPFFSKQAERPWESFSTSGGEEGQGKRYRQVSSGSFTVCGVQESIAPPE